ncbi:MAG TPA: pyruvate, phosphate dikinase [Myxococcales bacterium]|nr:pyruvate, phosphate dikinase [Myxococcales bacterium]
MNVYNFGGGTADGGKELRELLGGKGAHLAEMARLGLPVPPGFTISTEVCAAFSRSGAVPEPVKAEIAQALARLEQAAGAQFGGVENPLLISVRSGARVSMPGMMDTVLDLGLNDQTVEGLARVTGDRRFAFDCYRRFCAMYGGVVLGLGDEPFDEIFDARKAEKKAAADSELEADDLAAIVRASKELILARTRSPLPDDPRLQLAGAIEAVFKSWDNPRAVTYRKAHNIPAAWGTAVTVQMMVFGNRGDTSATGVAFSRDPSTGEPGLMGEFLAGAQGEDVVAGVRTPLPIAGLRDWNARIHDELAGWAARLEKHFKDVQDIEFTIERGKLYFLQCRSAKRTAAAAVRFAVDLANEGLIGKDEAVRRIEPSAIEQLQRPRFDPAALKAARAEGRLLGTGLPAGPGAAAGRLALTPLAAERMAPDGPVVLARAQTSPEDIRGMIAAAALLTSTGGLSSHAALVSRQMGKVAVVGCSAMKVTADAIAFDGRALREGEVVSIDGEKGDVYSGAIATIAAGALSGHLATLLTWADGFRKLGVRANADEGAQAKIARANGAEGIGLCRTEHMFFGPGKIEPMREMILARTAEERTAALAKLLPIQRRDFAGLFREMAGLPVIIRLLDPPLHEFVPHDAEGIAKLAASTGLPVEEVLRRSAELAETNPMLGLRGCRLGITYPEISTMQSRAIFEAACDVALEGVDVRPEIMIPLVGDARELEQQARLVHAAANAVFVDRVMRVKYHVGTMIEVPRAALTAGEVAQAAEFFSFGTNDLTQMTFGLSRDDVGPVLRRYQEIGIYKSDPFATLDRNGVGELMRIAIERGRAANAKLELGVCGEHGGDPESIALCHELGLDYVSCSPGRVPVARLAAAQAALKR